MKQLEENLIQGRLNLESLQKKIIEFNKRTKEDSSLMDDKEKEELEQLNKMVDLMLSGINNALTVMFIYRMYEESNETLISKITQS